MGLNDSANIISDKFAELLGIIGEGLLDLIIGFGDGLEARFRITGCSLDISHAGLDFSYLVTHSDEI